VVALHGELDFSEKARIERELSQIDKFGPGAITILDLSGVRYVDPTILNSLIGVRKRLERDQPGSSVVSSHRAPILFGEFLKLPSSIRSFASSPMWKRHTIMRARHESR